MRTLWLCVTLAACGGSRATPAPGLASPPTTLEDAPPGQLRPVAAFAAIGDRADRSRALFLEASRVLLHPRCVNCHPAGDVPHQGMTLVLHDPPVQRGPADRGAVGMECTTCHQDRNQQLTRVPGAPEWHLAPLKMAWIGKTPAEICVQLKDPDRNGHRTLAQIVDHSAHDKLVGWGWSPGADREPAPGTQQQFGDLVAAWVETGAACPADNQQQESSR